MFPARFPRGRLPGVPCLLAVLACAWPGSVPARAAGTLTLDEALRRTRASHPALLAARHEAGAARSLERDARRFPEPRLVAALENLGGGLGSDRAEATLTLEQTLELGGDRGARRAEARAAVLLAEALRDQVLDEAEAATVEHFCAAWLAQERAARLSEAVRDAGVAVAASAERLRAGAAPAHEELRARADRTMREVELRQTERDLAVARGSLARQWGGAPEEAGRLELPELDDVRPPAWDSVAARLEVQPAVRRQAAERLHAEAAVRGAGARRVPDVTLAAGARHLADVPGTGWVATLSLPLPMPGAGRGAHAAALAARAAAVARADAAGAGTLNAARGAHERLAAALASRRELREQALPAATAALREIAAGFRAGRFAYHEVQSGQRGVLEARLRELELTAEAWRARLELERWLTPPPARTGFDAGDVR